jgi:hypothetical protein
MVPFAWFTADETYGQTKRLQAWLEEKGIWYSRPESPDSLHMT